MSQLPMAGKKIPLYWTFRNRHKALVGLPVGDIASLTAATLGKITPSTVAPRNSLNLCIAHCCTHTPTRAVAMKTTKPLASPHPYCT